MENEKSFAQIMDDLVSDCESVLGKYLPDPQNMPEGEQYTSTIAEAMRYSVMAGGKRLRPVMMQAAFEMCGGKSGIEPFMAMICLDSLILEKLPKK